MESQTRKREHGNQNMEKAEYGNDERGNMNMEVRVSRPMTVNLYWNQYPWILGESFCKISVLLICRNAEATYVSVLTIVAFSTERYLAICYPLHLHTMSGFQRALWIIGCLWIIALLSATPFSIYSTVDYLTYPPDSDNILEESAFCAMMSQPESLPLAELSFLLFFLIPMIINGSQYTRMALKYRNKLKNWEKVYMDRFIAVVDEEINRTKPSYECSSQNSVSTNRMDSHGSGNPRPSHQSPKV
ncbi:hypothetical protein FQR65_LT18989 [Abscondita terminalis]|nr:hypothetical protein FQR65_LT18989 [Abscondita terminalis]